ncbi:MAG: rhomboid family intramembrane serine protease [Sphingobacteriia bacterium]|nr:MAG: rhomboid family intramembrane serine protease [Sphingobacteriia bacterium]
MITMTFVLLGLTALVSFLAFNNANIIEKLIFHPPALSRGEHYRWISCGFVHADLFHLVFNMYAFYLFGKMVEPAFGQLFGDKAGFLYVLLYLSAIGVSMVPSYFQHKDDFRYNSLGASGAVSAIVFAGILLQPTMGMGIFPIPFFIPGFLFGPLYLGVSYYLAKRGQGNINHSAHIWGAMYGVVFLAITTSFMSDYPLLSSFWEAVRNYAWFR